MTELGAEFGFGSIFGLSEILLAVAVLATLGFILCATLSGFLPTIWRREQENHRSSLPKADVSAVAKPKSGRRDPRIGLGRREEVDQTARTLIQEHGAEVVIAAARRTLAGLAAEDWKRREVWRQVLLSAEESLQRERQEMETAEAAQ